VEKVERSIINGKMNGNYGKIEKRVKKVIRRVNKMESKVRKLRKIINKDECESNKCKNGGK
jgi:hypothetical protein